MTDHVQAVSDFASNRDDQIRHFAELIGAGDKRTLFAAIYHGKLTVKSVKYLSDQTNLTSKRVLTLGKFLDDIGAVRLVKNGGRVVGYERVRQVKTVKDRILRAASNRAQRECLATKARPKATVTVTVRTPKGRQGRATRLTIDDIGSFSRAAHIGARSVPEELVPPRLPESQFKHGVRLIIGEQGEFRDHGGEDNDLLTTHLRFKGKRVTAAFAFKGPGKSGPLTPGKMGKNGDQIQRLVDSPARPDIVFVQYEGEIRETVDRQLLAFAGEKARAEGRNIGFGTIGRVDSYKLRIAYPKCFEKALAFVKRKKRTARARRSRS